MTNMPKMPRLALGSWAFAFGPFAQNPWDFGRVCRYAAEAGYMGVEINGFRPHPHHRDLEDQARVAVVRRELAEAGVEPVVYAPDFTAVPPSEVAEVLYLDEIDSARALCERMGITLLRVDTVSSPAQLPRDAYERRFERLVTTWKAAARRCANSGLTLIWEFEPGFWLNRPSEVLELAKAVGEENFRILFDSSHAYAGAVAGARQGPEPEVLARGEVEYAELLQPYVGHLHLIDGDGSLHDEETSQHLPFGTGQVDFLGLLRALRPTVDRLDWWGVDFCFCATTEADARNAVPFVRSLARELRESQA